MISHGRVSSSQDGARPSLRTLERIGTYTSVGPHSLHEGDVILYGGSVWCIVKKASQFYKGNYITLRELVSNTIRTVRIEPHMRVSRFEISSTVSGQFEGRWASWKLAVGDIVFYPDRNVLAIRHSNGWYRTAAPWSQFADAEIVHDVFEGPALMVRSCVRPCPVFPETDFQIGSAVATRDLSSREPSVWFRQAEDYWVGNSRQAPLSDQMIRYELSRRTFQSLRLPEAT